MARIRNLLGDITDLSNEIASLSDDDDDPTGEAILKKSVRDAKLKELFDQSNSCWKQHTRLIIHDDSRTYTRTSIRFRLEDGTTLLSPKDIRDVDKVYVEPADPIEPCKVVFDETVDFALVFSDVSYLLVRFLSGRYYLFDTSYSIRKWNPATNGQVAATGPDPPSASPNPRCASPPGWQVASAHLSHSACDVLTCDLQPWLQSFLASASSTGGAMGSTGRAPPLPMTIATTVVPNLETFVEILGVVPAQQAVGAALRQHWVDAQQAPFFYIARDVAGTGGMRWAVGRGVHSGPGPWLSPTPRFAVAVAPVSSTHEPRPQFWAPDGSSVHLVAVLLSPQNRLVGDVPPLAPSTSDLCALDHVCRKLDAEVVSALFHRRRLLCAAMPYAEADGEPVVCLVVRGAGTPIDEEPLPTKVAGFPTRVVYGMPPRLCAVLDPPEDQRVEYGGPPLRARAALRGPPGPRVNEGSFGAYVRTADGAVAVATAGHVLMTADEKTNFDSTTDDEAAHGRARAGTYPTGDVFHRLASLVRPVGTRLIDPWKSSPASVTDFGLVTHVPDEWLAQPEHLHVIPGCVLDDFATNSPPDPTLFPMTKGHTVGECGDPTGDLSATGISLVGVADPFPADSKRRLYGAAVGKVGKTTGLTFGRVVCTGMVVNVERPTWPHNDGATDAGPPLLLGQIAVAGTTPVFCTGGDSGALVWTATGTPSAEVVGILHTMMSIQDIGMIGVVTPATALEKEHGIKFCIGDPVDLRFLPPRDGEDN